ncbi:MAG: serine/threonine protein kinase [Burkholderiaceae bacterium]|nr:serine/threonine protein kinase [Burkholderiaceae bacterium]
MSPDRWQRAQALFAEAVALPVEAREAHVRLAAADDATLCEQVLALLAHDADTGTIDAGGVQHVLQRAAAQAVGVAPGGGADRLAGQRLGPWRIVRHLADGGMGAVYLAERADGAFVQQVAIKLLNPAAVSPEAAARLAAERRLLARLQHPRIARLLDGGTSAEGAPYLVMEYVDGLPIDRWCDAQAVNTRARLHLVQQVCAAVDHAHRSLVVHRDIKPGNILVDAEGHPRLLDFGIAKLLDDDAEVLTRANERLLTPSHASPEQLRGEPVTTATDVYALGVLLYQLLARRRPFPLDPTRATHTGELARQILDTPARRPSDALPPDLPDAPRLRRELAGDLDTIVLKALHKDPQRRYASAAALADDLERWLTHRPVLARPDAWTYRLRKGLRRHWAPVGGAVVVAVGVAGLTGLYLQRLGAERDLAQRERAAAEQVTGFLSDLFENASPEVQADADFTVRQMVDGAAARVDQALAGQPEAQLRLLHILGKVYRQLGDWQASADALQRAVDLARDAQLPSSAQLGRAWAELSNTLSQLGRYDEAIAAARTATPHFRAALGDADFETVESMMSHGMRLNTAGRFDEAEEAMRAMPAAIARVVGEGDRHILERQFSAEQGKLAAGRGQWADAAAAFQRSLALTPDDGLAFGARDAIEARLALARMSAGHFDDALATLEASQQRMRRQAGAGHRRVFLAHNLMARVHWQAGRMVDAEREARAALAGWQVDGGGEVLAASMAVNLGQALWGQGRLGEADAVLAQALARLTPEGDAAYGAALRVAAGGVAVDAGRTASGLRAMLAALPAPARAGEGQADARSLPLMLPVLRAHLAAGDLSTARRLLQSLDAESLARQPPQATFAWRLAWLRAWLAWSDGHTDAAAAALAAARRALDAMSSVAPWKPAVQAALEAALQGRPLDADLHAALQSLPPGDGWRVLATTAPRR